MEKKKIKNLHVRVSGGVNVSGSSFLAPKMFDCIITNDEIGKTLSSTTAMCSSPFRLSRSSGI